VTGQNEDAAWQEIIANYGDRPALDSDEDTQRVDQRADQRVEHSEVQPDPVDWPQERFVPPPPPPLPRPPIDRLAAWAGVFVSPVLLLIATVLRVPIPAVVVWLLVGAFLGGFGYLVTQMPRGPRDPFDDGARL
jgi:hypothetical protein